MIRLIRSLYSFFISHIFSLPFRYNLLHGKLDIYQMLLFSEVITQQFCWFAAKKMKEENKNQKKKKLFTFSKTY